MAKHRSDSGSPISWVILGAIVLGIAGGTLVIGAEEATVPTRNVVVSSGPFEHFPSALGATGIDGLGDIPQTTQKAVTSAPTAPPAQSTVPTSFVVTSTATMTWSSTLTPPNFTGVFRLIDPAHGYLATGGTTYLIAHSYAKGYGAPGNLWETFKVGDIVTYDGVSYRIDYTATPAQNSISSQPIWTNNPNELVLITCKSRGTAATNNVVIRAERIG